MKIIYHPKYIDHLTGDGHPECPERCRVVIDALKKAGLMNEENTVIPSKAPIETVLLCHSPEYLSIVEDDIRQGKQLLSTGDVQICPASMHIALLASGAGIAAVDEVMERGVQSVFCCVRPPGHHATRDQGMGFCIFNHVAIAARYAQTKYSIQRILIVDWDVHHGNGTQDIFYDDPSVFYFSTHQLGLYPGTGKAEETGASNILNCPIRGGLGSREEVLQAFREKLTEAMIHFRPELIFISAGFDAHVADPLGGFDLTTQDFFELTTIVRKLADEYSSGRLISMLEGGYNLHALAESTLAHVKVLV